MRLAVLGDPVAHSLSPELHTAALEAVGIKGSYEARRVDDAGMVEAIADLRAGRLHGANVTMPHKHLAAELADELADTARHTGAVNTLVVVGGRIFGHNTDIAGVTHAWHWAGLPTEGPVVILGAGGAAAAALVALVDRDVAVATRRPEAASELVAKLRPGSRTVEFGTGVPGAVVVNATPLGMHGESLPDEVLSKAAGIFDMAYGAQPTPAVMWARAAGLPCADGPAMLLGQAAASFRLWTGRAAVPAMREALASRRTAQALT